MNKEEGFRSVYPQQMLLTLAIFWIFKRTQKDHKHHKQEILVLSRFLKPNVKFPMCVPCGIEMD